MTAATNISRCMPMARVRTTMELAIAVVAPDADGGVGGVHGAAKAATARLSSSLVTSTLRLRPANSRTTRRKASRRPVVKHKWPATCRRPSRVSRSPTRRVAKTMSEKITAMDGEQGFVGSLVTAILVILASWKQLPVSTTHVSVGSLFGIAAVSGTARWKTILLILTAWITTLPLAAALAAAVYVVIR